jgi:hypothetical protein
VESATVRRILSRLFRWLERPISRFVVIALGVLLAAPALGLGFFSDDYAFLAFLEKRAPVNPPPWDLYRFFSGDEAITKQIVAGGAAPWWTWPGLRLHFFRPLPSELLALDHAVFKHAALGWHAHSLLWYVALLFAASELFRRLLPPLAATLALAAYTFSGGNVFAFAWPSARHAVVAALLSAVALAAYLRRGDRGALRAPGAAAFPYIAFTVSLLAGETALGGIALALAYEALGPARGTRRERARRAVPLLVIAGVYLVGYAVGGAGARGSEDYASPFADPVGFLRLGATHLPILVASAILGIPAELATLAPPLGLAAVGLFAAALAFFLWRACAPSLPDDLRAHAPWLTLGAIAATSVCAGGIPGTRELIVANFAFATLFALLVGYGTGPGPHALARRVGIGALALIHLVLAPLGQLLDLRSMDRMGRATDRAALDLLREANADRDVFIVAASDPFAGMYAPLAASASGEKAVPSLGCVTWLAGVRADVTVTRMSARSIAIEPNGRTFLTGPFEALFRAAGEPLKVGDEASACGARVRVAAIDQGRPSRIEVVHGRVLDAYGGAWIAWRNGRFERLALPAIGQSVRIPWSAGPSGIY